jgi:hypothetical protein
MLVRPNGLGTRFRPIREIDYKALRLLTERSVGSSPLKLELAVRRLDKAWREGRLGYPDDEPPEWKWRMCEARMMLGDYSEWRGWEYRSDWSAGLWHNPEGSWQGERVKTLHVFGEQGVGDEVCFAQVLPDIKGLADEIIFETDPRLVGIFNRSLPVTAVPALHVDGIRKFRKPDGPWMPLGDLLRNFRRSLGAFKREPYLVALPGEVERFKAYKGRTGISWRGAQGSYALQEFQKAVQEPLGLQYDIGWDEEVEVPDLDLRNDLEGLLGLLSNLDRVVTVSTSVAHFAGALGIKTDVILAPLNGIRKNLLPFKWHCSPMWPKTPWMGDNVTVYRNLDEYLRASKES